MECITAQELLSASHDGEPIAIESLDSARAHCAACPECTAFVALLEALDDILSAAVPRDLVTAIMREIDLRGDADASLRADRVTATYEEGSRHGGARPDSDSAPAPVPAKNWSELLAHAFSERNRTEVVAWIAAAAVVFAAAGIGGIAGMRAILVPAPPSSDTIALSGSPESATDAAKDMQVGTLSAQTEAADTEAGAASTAVATDAQFIVLEGTVYRLVGELPADSSEIDLATTRPAGSVSAALDSGTEQTYPAQRTEDGALVYLVSATQRWKFERVVRSFDGRMYVLRGESISSYGDWPAWPRGVKEPVGDDGGADFEALGADDLGARVYAPAGRDAASGIAVAPSSAPGDPVAGSGVWTWWEPALTQ